MELKKLVKDALVRRQDKRYEEELHKKQISYDNWVRDIETLKIKESERAISSHQIVGEKIFGTVMKDFPHSGSVKVTDNLVYVVLSRGRMSENATEICREYFDSHPEVLAAYGDEDVIKPDGTRCEPWFKPDWSPDWFDSGFYFGSLVIVRKELWDTVCEKTAVETKVTGIDNSTNNVTETKIVCEKIELLKLIYLCVETAGGYNRIANNKVINSTGVVGHISSIIFHSIGNDSAETDKFLPYQCINDKYAEYRQYLKERMNDKERADISRIIGSSGDRPLVSVVIPSKDNPDILEKCLTALYTTMKTLFKCEIIVVDNGSTQVNKEKTESMIADKKYKAHESIVNSVTNKTISDDNSDIFCIKYIYEKMEFNFSHMCNMGAQAAKGDFLLFLNDDVELCEKDCLLKMAAAASRDYTGAVGIKLYYPGTDIIQHAGITNLPMGPVHKLQFMKDNVIYYHGFNTGRRNVSAVTAACLMVEKKKFHEAGGFTEDLKVAFNDVALCFALLEKGYYNVCLNDCHAYHHESLSRGSDESEEKLERLLKEREILYKKYPEMEGADSFYPKNLENESLDTMVRPAYETAGNKLQHASVKKKEKLLAGYRHDECLLVRVESYIEDTLYGYGVVLGDDNACYMRELLLQDTENRDIVYSVELEGMYRPDLMKNMPDQINVGLCGFKIKFEQSFVQSDGGSGRYYVGMAVKNRVNGCGIYNFTKRIVGNSNCRRENC
jgi:GT2 family glycosyltransferase